jgi:hypothetical protein
LATLQIETIENSIYLSVRAISLGMFLPTKCFVTLKGVTFQSIFNQFGFKETYSWPSIAAGEV